ncbi:MAG: oxaloacetate-decarboxylating malate dehydrogenase, partial [Vibrionaceae bacterium]|nr:oxaloacetate-decarboxylating malate dehydrogenase [Vibrionaceae bacterium]
ANATPLLERYRDQLCCFNDDIQGTAAVSVGTLLAACRQKGEQLSQQHIVFVGAGSAGCGIAKQIISQMCHEGLSDQQAKQQVFMIDRDGLLTDDMTNLTDFQKPLAHCKTDLDSWQNSNELDLENVVKQSKATVLIGVSGQPGLFSQNVIQSLSANTSQPIVLPLSNPTSRVEATPKDILQWSQGQAIVATGSPFEPVQFTDAQGNLQTREISQCNNSYIFPGVGLGVVAVQAERISEPMLMAASKALAESAEQATRSNGAILPALKDIQQISKQIAFAVAKQAIEEKLALPVPDDALQAKIEAIFWHPEYRQYRRTSF